MNDVQANPELAIVADFLREVLPFDELPEDLFNRCVTQLKIHYYRRGQIFQGEEDEQGLRILRSGAAELRGDQEQLIDRLDEGLSFNLKGLRREQPDIKVVLIEDSLIYRLPESAYQQLRSSDRDFDRFFHSQRDRRMRRAARGDRTSSDMLRPVESLMSRQLSTIERSESIQVAAQKMTEHRVSSLLVLDADQQLCGIVTDRDVRSRAVAEGLDINQPIETIMTHRPHTILPSESLFDATLFMTRSGVHHIPVQTADKQLVGMVTASDLMLARQDDPVFIVQHISRQKDVVGLAHLVSSLPGLLVQWVAIGMRAAHISHTLTAVSDAVTQRLIQLFIDVHGEAPVAFCWLGFGSQGRDEQLLNADQDNGLLISDDCTDEQMEWFELLANFVCDGLNTCGYVYCPGDIMARSEGCRKTLSQWCQTVNGWAAEPTPDALMRVSIFFDLRAVCGDETLHQQLQQYMLKRISGNSIFFACLAENVLDIKPPLGVFRQFVVEHDGEHRHELNLKKAAVMPIVDAVRIHALFHGVVAVNTEQRLHALMNGRHMAISDARNLQDALRFIMQVRVRQQAEQIKSGEVPSNYLNPDQLSRLIRRQLRDAFTVINDSQTAVKMAYRGALG